MTVKDFSTWNKAPNNNRLNSDARPPLFQLRRRLPTVHNTRTPPRREGGKETRTKRGRKKREQKRSNCGTCGGSGCVRQGRRRTHAAAANRQTTVTDTLTVSKRRRFIAAFAAALDAKRLEDMAGWGSNWCPFPPNRFYV